MGSEQLVAELGIEPRILDFKPCIQSTSKGHIRRENTMTACPGTNLLRCWDHFLELSSMEYICFLIYFYFLFFTESVLCSLCRFATLSLELLSYGDHLPLFAGRSVVSNGSVYVS